MPKSTRAEPTAVRYHDHLQNAAEEARRTALRAAKILNTSPEGEFDAIGKAARRLFDCTAAYISFLDTDRQWFKARVGFEPAEVPRKTSLCAIAVDDDREICTSDLQTDVEFSAHPTVLAMPSLRFFVSIPVHVDSSELGLGAVPVGTLCVFDDKPREVSEDRIDELRDLAMIVSSMISARASANSAKCLAARRGELLGRLGRTSRLLAHAERIASIGSWRLDLETSRAEWSDQTYAIHGVPPGAGVPIDRALDFYPPRSRKVIRCAIQAAIEEWKPYDVEVDFTNAAGRTLRVRAMGEPVISDGKAIELIGVFQDVTQRYEMEQALRKVANTDDLTGVATRRAFNERAGELIEEGGPLGVVIVDLDRFKQVNDTYGHETGDTVLTETARRLSSPWLSDTLAARLGGDEFALLIWNEALLDDLSDTLFRLLGDLRIEVETDTSALETSATLGAAIRDASVDSLSELMRRADRGLYRAKEASRGTAAIYGDTGMIHPGEDEDQVGEAWLQGGTRLSSCAGL